MARMTSTTTKRTTKQTTERLTRKRTTTLVDRRAAEESNFFRSTDAFDRADIKSGREVRRGLRMWGNRNIGSDLSEEEVTSVEEAVDIIIEAIEEDLEDDSVTDNAFGVEERIDLGGKDGWQWVEWSNDDGEDVMEVVRRERGDDDEAVA